MAAKVIRRHYDVHERKPNPKIIGNKIRLKTYQVRGQVMLIATGLNNLRTRFINSS